MEPVRENVLYLVVPCYNEEEVLPHTAEVMREKMKRLQAEGKYLLRVKSCLSMMAAGTIHGTLYMNCAAGILFSRDCVFPEILVIKVRF